MQHVFLVLNSGLAEMSRDRQTMKWTYQEAR